MEYKISEVLGIPIDFDDKDFLEFTWIYRRVLKTIKERNQAASHDMLPKMMGNY
jgi:hypothetical protein